MNNIPICKYYEHPRRCTNNKMCASQLLSDKTHCCSYLYFSMALKQETDKYKQALNKIESRIQLENADDCLLDIMEIIKNTKES